jgi:hypothetical protein
MPTKISTIRRRQALFRARAAEFRLQASRPENKKRRGAMLDTADEWDSLADGLAAPIPPPAKAP